MLIMLNFKRLIKYKNKKRNRSSDYIQIQRAKFTSEGKE